MSQRSVTPTGVERTFGENELIVSKTDLQGRVTYANDVFLRLAGYTEAEILGQPHSLIRHPDMPRAVFKLLWDTIASGKEIFAYVVNMSRNGDHYWVYAHVTPTFGPKGDIIGYHSNRRVPDRDALEKIKPIYELLLREERKHGAKQDQVRASTALLVEYLKKNEKTYDEFVWSLAA
ncbi:MAG: PAS domain-containing protein [Polyangiaceae bacterium]